MIKIFKQLGRHWAACIAVVALLFVQAYCDLSLPDYTSKIVDIGIQQGGIESPVPETVRDTTLQALELLMSEQDAALAEQWYSAPDADGVRTLSHDATAAMSELENAFATPDIVLYMAATKNAATAAGTADAVTPTAYDLDAIATQFAAMSQAPGAREMLQSQLAAAFASLDDSVAGSLSSQAMLLVALEYEAQGIAHDVQMGYLLRTGLMAINPFFSNLPLFACCLIFSAVFCICTQKSAKINDMIDRPTVVRISGTALEYLIVSALATTNLGVFVTYAVPLIVVCIGVSIVTYWACFILGKRVLPKNGQFETGIGLFGQCCGVLATGLLLLKIVDPDYKTNAATNITSSSTLGYTYQLQYTLIFATLIMTSPLFTYIWSWLLLAVLLGCGLFFGRRIHARGE